MTVDTRTAIEQFSENSPPGMSAFIITLRALDDFEVGDVVLGWRADNGLRGVRHVHPGVIVGRYIDATDDVAGDAA